MNRTVKRRPVSGAGTNFEEMAWKASVRKHHAKLRRQRRGEWYCYFAALADSLRRSADEFEEKAAALLEDDEKGTP